MRRIPGLLIIVLIGTTCLFLPGCEKDITVTIPTGEQKLVVEAWIEPGLPPFVILTKSSAYFEKTDLKAFEHLFVHNADVKISDGSQTISLTEFCSNDYSDAELELIANAIGIPFETLRNVNYCMYTLFPSPITGKENTEYSLSILAEGKTYSATTTIPYIIPLDSVWFKVEQDQQATGNGFAWGHLSDPDTLGNFYNWKARRLGKDGNFLTPNGSTFDDKFINGQSFEFGYERPFDENDLENGDSSYYYHLGDTIIVKFSTIDQGHYFFRHSLEHAQGSGGNPFATPSAVKTNIEGGALGYFGGFGVSYDTIICR